MKRRCYDERSLRLENFIIGLDGNPFRVNQILFIEDVGYVARMHLDYETRSYKDLPIHKMRLVPMSEDILIGLGFEKDENGCFCFERYRIGHEQYGWYLDVNKIRLCLVDYLHEFQNIHYDITGGGLDMEINNGEFYYLK